MDSKIMADFPLVELHRHLDGNVRIETILDIAQSHGLETPAKTIEGLRPFVQVTEPKPSILDFFKKFEWLTKILVDYDTCRRVAYENIEDACEEGIDYIELRFSPWFMAEKNNLDPQGVVEAVIDGIRIGKKDFGIKANIIGIISRTYGPDICMQEFEALISCKDDICALDLAGDEINFPGSLFVEHFKKARNVGWLACPHAGEAEGPHAIWQAIQELGAVRIGHAVSAIRDEELLDFLAEQQIGIESNLTSNVQTTTVSDYEHHPLKTFLEKGIRACINTDDPGISAITLPDEYNIAAIKAGLSDEQIQQSQRNALALAFLSDQEKNELITQKKIMNNPNQTQAMITLYKNTYFSKSNIPLWKALRDLNISTHSHLAIRDGVLITDDEILHPSETIELIAVVSGG